MEYWPSTTSTVKTMNKPRSIQNWRARGPERTGSLKDAINYALTRVSCLERMPKAESVTNEIIHLRVILGLFMIEMNDFRRARETIAPVVQSVLKGPVEKRTAQLLAVTGACDYALEEDFPKAFEQLEQTVDLQEGQRMLRLCPCRVTGWGSDKFSAASSMKRLSISVDLKRSRGRRNFFGESRLSKAS